ncbi:unnamed protein product [Sphagnum troendelagicum]|uniref:Uncharacterized protein n=1 Tax=Sphagnum troendelagicum TaxID=128251 RepID=A0ABP0TN98_9BRYO
MLDDNEACEGRRGGRESERGRAGKERWTEGGREGGREEEGLSQQGVGVGTTRMGCERERADQEWHGKRRRTGGARTQGVTGTAMPHYLPIHNNCKNSRPKTAAS